MARTSQVTDMEALKRRRAVPDDDLPEMALDLSRAVIKRGGKVVGRPKLGDAKRVPISIKVAPDVLEHFRAGGPGWQTRMNEVLERAARKRRV